VSRLGARVVVAGTHSGVGKTTIATGLMAALRARGRLVGSAKVGPDYIDPGYHALATGRPPRNLDAWMCGTEVLPALAGRAGEGVDILVVEGVMGLFDGASDGTPSSTADVARLLDAPVLLVIDASSMSASVAAVVHGYATLDRDVRVAGVVLNQVGSPGHEVMLREAIEPLGVPVLGALHRDDALTWRDRHLGLVPVVERPTEVGAALDRLAAMIEQSLDLDGIVALAESAPASSVGAPPLPSRVADRAVRIAVAAGPAFSFGYPDNLEALAAAGAELVPFDPCVDARLPSECDALVAGGGFPEVYGDALSDNRPLLDDVDAAVRRGIVVWAECGGLLWLARGLDGRPMAGVLDAEATMTDRLTLGYRTARTCAVSPLGPEGVELRGHEFHYSTIEPTGDALDLEGRFGAGRAGFATPRLLASYLHVHLGARPDLAEAFVRTAAG
jgi:cobyrinic acid a,c-diamide synthase